MAYHIGHSKWRAVWDKGVRHEVDICRVQQVLRNTNINIAAIYLKFNDQDL